MSSIIKKTKAHFLEKRSSGKITLIKRSVKREENIIFTKKGDLSPKRIKLDIWGVCNSLAEGRGGRWKRLVS